MSIKSINLVSSFDTAGIEAGTKRAASNLKQFDAAATQSFDTASAAAGKYEQQLNRLHRLAGRKIVISTGEKAISKTDAQVKRMMEQSKLAKAMEGKGEHWKEYERERIKWEGRGKGKEFLEKFAPVEKANRARDKVPAGGWKLPTSARQIGRVGRMVAGEVGAAMGPLAYVAGMGKLAVPIAALTYLGSKALPGVQHVLEEMTNTTIPGFGSSLKQVDRALTDLFDYTAPGGLQRLHKDVERAEEDFKLLDKYTVRSYHEWSSAQDKMFRTRYASQQAEEGEKAYAAHQSGPGKEGYRTEYLTQDREAYYKREVDKQTAAKIVMQAADREYARQYAGSYKELARPIADHVDAKTGALSYRRRSEEQIDEILARQRADIKIKFERHMGNLGKAGPEGQAALDAMLASHPENEHFRRMHSPAEMAQYSYERSKTEGAAGQELMVRKQIELAHLQAATRDKLISQGKTLLDLELQAAIAASRWQNTEDKISDKMQDEVAAGMRRAVQQQNYAAIFEQQRQTLETMGAESRALDRILRGGDVLNEQKQLQIRLEEEYGRKISEVQVKVKAGQMKGEEGKTLIDRFRTERGEQQQNNERQRRLAHEQELNRGWTLNKYPGLSGRMLEIRQEQAAGRLKPSEANEQHRLERTHQRQERGVNATLGLYGRAQGLYDETRTVDERRQQGLGELALMQKTGMFKKSPETFMRSLAKISTRDQVPSELAANQRGSVEAYGVWASAQNQQSNFEAQMAQGIAEMVQIMRSQWLGRTSERMQTAMGNMRDSGLLAGVGNQLLLGAGQTW